jgi:hypothetical protein
MNSMIATVMISTRANIITTIGTSIALATCMPTTRPRTWISTMARATAATMHAQSG